MGLRLQETPSGVVVQNDDGTVVLVPPEVADQIAPIGVTDALPGAPPGAPPTSAAGAGPPPPIAPPPMHERGQQPLAAVSPVPSVANTPLQPPPAPVGPPPLATPSPIGENAQASETSRGAPPPVPGGASVPSPGTGALGQPADPFEQEATAALMAGEAAAAKAQAEEQTLAARNERLAAMQADADKLRLQNEERRAAMQTQYDTAVTAYADHKIAEPEPGWGQIVAWVLGGIGAALNKSDRNPVIEQWDRMTAERVRQQEADRARLGDLADRAGRDLDRFVAHAKDQESVFSTRMAGEAERFAREIEVTAAKYGGDAAQANAAAGAAQVRQRRDAYVQQAVERDWQHAQQESRLALDQFQAVEGVKARKQEIGLGYSRLSEDRRQFGLNFEEQRRQFDKGMEQRARDLDLEAEKLAQQGEIERAKLAKQEAKDVRQGGIGTATGDPLRQKDGSVYVAPGTESESKMLRDRVASAYTAATLIDELVRLRNQYGWSSDLVKSDEWRKMQANKGAIIVEMKNAAQLGALSGPDMDLINSMLSTSDPTEVRDPVEGLRKARGNLVLGTKNALRARQFTGDFDIPDLSSVQAAPRDDHLHALMTRSPFESGGAAGGGIGALRRDPRAVSTGPAADVLRGIDTPEARAKLGGLSTEQQLGLDGLMERVRGGDAQAAEGLATAAVNAPNPNARAAAAAALIALKRDGSEAAAQVLESHLRQSKLTEAAGKAAGAIGR